jgi:PPOX class probable F420-dependent enzyme
MAEKIPTEARHLLEGANLAHVSTLNEDGSPQTSPVWIDHEDGRPVFNTAKGRVKPENIQRDSRVSFSIHNQENPYESILVQGRAEIEEEGADEHIDKLAKKYLGEDEYPFRQPGEERLIVRVTPEKVSYTPPA